MAVTYFAALCAVLLYPFDFSASSISATNTVNAQPDGIHFGPDGMLRSAKPPIILYEHLIAGEGLTLEVWLTTASAAQEGPARIISYSLDPWQRNFTLGQERSALNIRLRTTKTDQNGTHPSLEIPDVFRPGTTQHVVVTYDFKLQHVYVDGKLRATAPLPQGNFRTWDRSSFLVFGNEATGARPWHGTIAYAAIYDRALPEDAVAARFRAGMTFQPPPNSVVPFVALDFTRGLEERDNAIAATVPSLPMPALTKPETIYTQSRAIFSFFRGVDGNFRLVGETSTLDLVRNVILFVPFGIFVAASLRRHVRSTTSTVVMTVLLGTFVSAAFEAVQFFLIERTSSIFDVATNMAGTMCGAAILYLRTSASATAATVRTGR